MIRKVGILKKINAVCGLWHCSGLLSLSAIEWLASKKIIGHTEEKVKSSISVPITASIELQIYITQFTEAGAVQCKVNLTFPCSG